MSKEACFRHGTKNKKLTKVIATFYLGLGTETFMTVMYQTESERPLVLR